MGEIWWLAACRMLLRLLEALTIVQKDTRSWLLTRFPVARPVSRSLSLSLSATFRLLLAGADAGAAVGSAGCFRFCARACSPVGVPVRVLVPLSTPRLSLSCAPLAPGKKSRNAAHKSGASLNNSSTFAKTSACLVQHQHMANHASRKDERCSHWIYDSKGSPKIACMYRDRC